MPTFGMIYIKLRDNKVYNICLREGFKHENDFIPELLLDTKI